MAVLVTRGDLKVISLSVLLQVDKTLTLVPKQDWVGSLILDIRVIVSREGVTTSWRELWSNTAVERLYEEIRTFYISLYIVISPATGSWPCECFCLFEIICSQHVFLTSSFPLVSPPHLPPLHLCTILHSHVHTHTQITKNGEQGSFRCSLKCCLSIH